MEKELNLVEVLKDAPKGTKLYSPLLGECELKEITKDIIYIKIEGKNIEETFYSKGTYYANRGECLLFPSKENRDWSTFKIVKDDFQVGDYVKVKSSDKVYLIKQIKETGVLVSDIINSSNDFEFSIDKSIISEKVTKFDPKWLKPFDRVLVKDTLNDNWEIALFSHIGKYSYVVETGFLRRLCIPYNTETKHLLGTSLEEPEFYKI